MSILFSIVTFFGLIVTAAAGAAWAIQAFRHRRTRARVVCIAAAAVTVLSFVAFGVTHDPSVTYKDPPVADDAGPAQDVTQPPEETPTAATTPVTTPELETAPQGTTEPPATPSVPEDPGPATTPEDPPEEEQEPPEEIDPIEQAKQDIETAARAIVADNYPQTDVSRVTVNEDYGTEVEGDFVLLMYLTWNVKNSAKMTNKMLVMYSEDFAARVGSDLENVQEVALFWTAPYHSETDTAVKCSYERRGSGMYQTDKITMIE